MIYAPDKLYGIDKKISLIQRYLDAKLSELWGNIHIYGAINEITKDNNAIPYVYTSDGEYKELYLDDNKSVQICFIVRKRNVSNALHSAAVDIVFNCNLILLQGNDLGGKEKILLQAVKVIQKSSYTREITAINEGVKSVYSGFYIDQLINKDMQPYYVFSIGCTVSYGFDIELK